MIVLQLVENIDRAKLWEIVEGFDESVITTEEKKTVKCLLLEIEQVSRSRGISMKKCVFHILHAQDIYLTRSEIKK